MGGSPSCRACETASSSGRHTHTPACRARFDALIRADRVGRTPRTPAALTPAPEAEAPSTPMSVLDEPVEAVSDADPSELPFSARIPPGHSETAMPAKTNTEFDEIFLQANADRRNYRRMYQSSGSNTLFEYACDENSAVGEVCDEIGVDGIRLYIP